MQNARYWVASSLLAIALVHTVPDADSREVSEVAVQFDLPAQPLATSLLAIGQISGQQIIFPGETMAGIQAPAIRGRLSAAQAVSQTLIETGYRIERRSGAIFVVQRAKQATASSDAENMLVVTGTRIRGSGTASPVYTYEASKARDQGITGMQGLAASIPQNFSGGQTPGIGNGAELAGSMNEDSSTALNLRGLGPGSTLTLLNGHRLAYNVANQSIDFSSIPFAAVERVEVMPDGASALYGADAIGGVANIILKKDLHGLTVASTIGAATQGGYLTQNYNAVGGVKWQSGGVVVTANYDSNSAINAGDRSFTAPTNKHLTLFPKLESYAFLANAHQDIGDILSVGVDAFYSHRDSVRGTPYTPTGTVKELGLLGSTSSANFSVAPSATVRMSDWQISLTGLVARTDLKIRSEIVPFYLNKVTVRNRTVGSELAGEGPLFSVPAGEVRLAVGGGYRRDRFLVPNPTAPVSGSQENIFGYAELNVPLAAPYQGLNGFYRASLEAAVRYEDYPGIGRLATPKLGLIWGPTADLDFKLSWGRSFRAPTLYQRINPPWVYLLEGTLRGEREAPPGQTIILIDGGNPDLSPEKASSVSASLVLHPRATPGLEASVSAFKVNYSNRVVAPIASWSRALIDPAFANLINLLPSPDAIASAIALSPTGLDDQTGFGAPFDPASVYAIMDARYRNVAQDRIKGIDLTVRYRFEPADAGSFELYGSASYLDTSRKLFPASGPIDLSGTIFNPPRFKMRSGLSWSRNALMTNLIANYIGGVTDNRLTETDKVSGIATFDLSIKYHLGSEIGGIDIQATALNIFDKMPDRIRQASVIYAPYDSTNYSAIGRYLSLSLTKSF